MTKNNHQNGSDILFWAILLFKSARHCGWKLMENDGPLEINRMRGKSIEAEVHRAGII